MVYSLLLLDSHDEQNTAGEHSLEFHDGAWAEPNTTEHIVAGVSSKSADGLREKPGVRKMSLLWYNSLRKTALFCLLARPWSGAGMQSSDSIPAPVGLYLF